MTQLNTKKFKINFVIHIDSLFMILCPYDFISYTLNVQIKYQVHLIKLLPLPSWR